MNSITEDRNWFQSGPVGKFSWVEELFLVLTSYKLIFFGISNFDFFFYFQISRSNYFVLGDWNNIKTVFLKDLYFINPTSCGKKERRGKIEWMLAPHTFKLKNRK